MTLPGTYWIYGYVSDGRGAISGATVSISGDSCETDASGYYQLNAIGENDNSRVTIEAIDGSSTVTSYIYLDTNNLTTQQDFLFGEGKGFPGNFYVYGNVTNDGNPVESADVVFCDSQTSNSILTQTDASGYYQVNLNTISNDGDTILASASKGTNYVDDEFTLNLNSLTENVDFDFSTGTTLLYDTSDSVFISSDILEAEIGFFPADVIPIADSRIFEDRSVLADVISIAEAATFESQIPLEDIITVNDNTSLAWAFFPFDSVAVSDSTPTFTDKVYPSDAVNIIETFVTEDRVPISDSLGIVDSYEVTLIVPITDSVSISDTVTWVWKYTPHDEIAIIDYNSIPKTGEASVVALRSGCGVVNLQVEWAGYSSSMQKEIRTINFWDSSDIAVLDNGLSNRTVKFQGYISNTLQYGKPPYMAINTINAIANQGDEIEMEFIEGHISSGIYIIKSFSYSTVPKTVDLYKYELELEYVRAS